MGFARFSSCVLAAFGVAACTTAYLSQDNPSVNLPARGAPADAAIDSSFSWTAADGATDWATGGGGGEGGSPNAPPADPTSPAPTPTGPPTPPPPPTRSPGKIECGGAQCTGADACCVSFTAALSCGQSCQLATIRCDEPADCGDGNRCCASQSSAGTQCAATCGAQYVLCVTDADCDSGTHCVPAGSPFPAPYMYCHP